MQPLGGGQDPAYAPAFWYQILQVLEYWPLKRVLFVCRADRPFVPLFFSHKPVILSSSGLHALRVREERKVRVKKVGSY